MSVTIRLARYGKNNYATYRISVADKRKAATGRFLQQIGHYDPNPSTPTLKIDEKCAIEWMLKGAQLSNTVRGLFKHQGILAKFKQVKSGKPLEETTASVVEWKTKKKKPSKKALKKADAGKEAPKSSEKAQPEKSEGNQQQK